MEYHVNMAKMSFHSVLTYCKFSVIMLLYACLLRATVHSMSTSVKDFCLEVST